MYLNKKDIMKKAFKKNLKLYLEEFEDVLDLAVESDVELKDIDIEHMFIAYLEGRTGYKGYNVKI